MAQQEAPNQGTEQTARGRLPKRGCGPLLMPNTLARTCVVVASPGNHRYSVRCTYALSMRSLS
jgi:hypothetical protein